MKIVIGYPPTVSEKGLALLSQNRQFQWFSHATSIFPVVLGSAATMLKAQGHDVTWLDCVAEGIDMPCFTTRIQQAQPDFFIFETKTPVIKQHWQLVKDLKSHFPQMKIVMLGDHVTHLPRETMEAAPVDYVVCGGDFDFALAALLDSIQNDTPIPHGVLSRKDGVICGNDQFELASVLDTAPMIDRALTKWELYQREYNLQGKPFMYIMSGRDCWHGQCTFCAWPTLFPRFRVRSPQNVIDEVQMLVDRYGVKEIFDDSGTLNIGKWLSEFCDKLIASGLSNKTMYSCNMRFGALGLENYKLMKKAGFRLLKFGLESANQETLDRLKKKITVEDITEGCKMAKQAGLNVHLTMIVGYPWETKEDALRTLALAKHLMQKGYADVLQATTLVPYPGTPMHEEAVKNDGFLFNPKDYDRFDMGEPVLKAKMKPEEVREICNMIYKIFLTPQYVWQRIKSIRHPQDLAFLARGAKAVLGHLRDFGKEKDRARI